MIIRTFSMFNMCIHYKLFHIIIIDNSTDNIIMVHKYMHRCIIILHHRLRSGEALWRLVLSANDVHS